VIIISFLKGNLQGMTSNEVVVGKSVLDQVATDDHADDGQVPSAITTCTADFF